MSDINTRLAANLTGMLDRTGFDMVIQHRSATASDFDIGGGAWSNVATVKAVWDAPYVGSEGMDGGGPRSTSRRLATIAYRDDLKDTSGSSSYRVSAQGVQFNLISTAVIGKAVGLRLTLEQGDES